MTWGAILWENSQQLFVYSTRLPRLFVQILLIQSMQKTCKFFPAMQRRYSTFFGRWSIRIVATNWAIERGRGVAYASISSSLVPPSTVSGCGKEVLFSFKWSLRLCVGWSCVVCILFLPFQKLKLLLSSGTFWFACLDVLFGCFSCWIVSDPIRIISKDQERWTFSNQFSLMIGIRMFKFHYIPFLFSASIVFGSSSRGCTFLRNETCLDQFENPKLPAQVAICVFCMFHRKVHKRIVLMPLSKFVIMHRFNRFGYDNLGFITTWFFPPCSFLGTCLGRVSWFGLTQQWNHLQQTDRNRQKPRQHTHFHVLIPNASLSNPRDILPCGCIGVVVTIHSFLAMPAMLPLILAVAAVKCLAECQTEENNLLSCWGSWTWQRLFWTMHFEQFPNPKLHHGLLWHQLFQKRIFEHFNNTIFGKEWQLISMRQTWMVSKLFCEDINHLYVYCTCVAPSSRVFLLDFRRLKSQLYLAPGLVSRS